jgi:hypothetical protein
LADEAARDDEIGTLLPFARRVVALEESRRRMESIDGEKNAEALATIAAETAPRTEPLTGRRRRSIARPSGWSNCAEH